LIADPDSLGGLRVYLDSPYADKNKDEDKTNSLYFRNFFVIFRTLVMVFMHLWASDPAYRVSFLLSFASVTCPWRLPSF
jgi:hypothetical protein